MENLNKDFTLVGSKGSDSTEKIAKPALSFFQDAWRRFKKNKVALVAMWIIAITLVFSVISAFVVPQSKANYFNPNKSQVYGNLPPKLSGDLPFWNGEFKAPGSTERTDVYKSQDVPSKDKYVFGTDKYGRSLAKRTVVGLRISLIIALAAALIDLVIGVTYGIISGWMGGKVDMVMQRIIEIIQSVPNLVVVTMLALLLGQGISSIIIAIGLFAWTGMARQVRNMVLSYKERDFVLASKTLGQSTWKIAVKHLLP
ncbi:MAG: ABC transporter permease, partial [Lactococcus cremoris]